jgi:hypothetical protein
MIGKFNLTAGAASEAQRFLKHQSGFLLDQIHAPANAIGGRNSHAPNQLLMATLNPIRW